MKKFVIIILNIGFCLSLHSNCLTPKDSLSILEIENSELIFVFDSIVTYEKGHDNYSKELIYQVMLMYNQDSSMQITIGSAGDYILKNGYEIGVFDFEGHMFVVSGIKLDKTLFKRTKKTKSISYYSPDCKSDEIMFYEDDSHSYWVYKYYKRKFTLISGGNK